MKPHHIAFIRREDGAALVEFAIALPLMLLLFAVIVEGSRMMIAFQAAIGGVRDATRYMSRVLPGDICSSGLSIAGYADQLRGMVSDSITGQTVFPTGVSVVSVAPSYSCVTGTFRNGPAPVVEVTASILVTYPFTGIFTLTGGALPDLTTTITDRARVFGS